MSNPVTLFKTLQALSFPSERKSQSPSLGNKLTSCDSVTSLISPATTLPNSLSSCYSSLLVPSIYWAISHFRAFSPPVPHAQNTFSRYVFEHLWANSLTNFIVFVLWCLISLTYLMLQNPSPNIFAILAPSLFFQSWLLSPWGILSYYAYCLSSVFLC